MTDAQGIPLAAFTDSAGVAEVHLLEPTLASIPQSIRLPERMPLIADRAYDSDPLRATLAERGIDLIAPHRKNRTAKPTNDGRKMRQASDAPPQPTRSASARVAAQARPRRSICRELKKTLLCQPAT